MIVDTSAVLAILFDEPDADRFIGEIAQASGCRMSAANFLEAAFVIEARAGFGKEDTSSTFSSRERPSSWCRYPWNRHRLHDKPGGGSGKGNHPAGLNFGDCFAYALAEITGESLLYKGEDFTRTDVETA